MPVEWDEVKTQLMRLATELGPKTGVSGTSVSRFIDSAANALDGNGDKLRQTLAQLSGAARIFAEGSGNIVDIIKNLQVFVTALRDSKEQIVMFQNRLASLTSVVNDNRSDLDAALSDLSVALGEVQRFVAGSRNQTSEQIRSLASVTQNLVDNRMALENVLHISPNAIANYENIYYPEAGAVTGAFSLANFANPVYFFCGLIGAVENTTAPETAKLCAQYLGPALRLLNFNYLPFPTNLYLRPALDPKYMHLHRSEAGTRRRRTRRRARTAANGVGVHRYGRCGAASGSGLGTATWTARTVWTGRGACDPIACVVPRRTDTRAAHHHPGFVADDERRWHVAPPNWGAGRTTAAARSTVACGSGGAVMIRAAHAWGYRPPEGQGESRIHLSRVKRLAVVGACLALALTGCSFQGLNSLPLPGAVGRGSDAVTYHVEVPNVATLESNSPVMINDVVVGSVGKMTVDAWHANVEISVKPDVVVPANAVATVGQTSLLGSMHLALNPPLGEKPSGRLQPGATIGLNQSSTYPTTEQTLSSLSTVVNAGGLGQIGDIIHNFNTALSGREPQIRELLTRLDNFVGVLDAQRDNIIASIQQLRRVAGTFAGQRDVLDRALKDIPPALDVLIKERPNLTTRAAEARDVQRHRHPVGQRRGRRSGDEPQEPRAGAQGTRRCRTRPRPWADVCHRLPIRSRLRRRGHPR